MQHDKRKGRVARVLKVEIMMLATGKFDFYIFLLTLGGVMHFFE